MKPLTDQERRVILQKDTERPFTGAYCDYWADGTYTCRQCGAPLYRSQDKFDAGCGWPSFDDEIPGAVKRVPDADGRRTEIVCAHCGGHLGHVFAGEEFTAKNLRHCVNSLSIVFESAQPSAATNTAASVSEDTAAAAKSAVAPSSNSAASLTTSDTPAAAAPCPTIDIAYFAGGCFWGVEYMFERQQGVLDVESGYMGGREESPTYEQVSRHATGHAEAVRVTYDPSKISYETLARLFFEIHDPTQVDGQGPDIGDQYRSEIFYTTEEQRSVVEQLIDQLRTKGYDVITRLTPAAHFWTAETYHQDYYQRKGSTPYCHVYTRRF